MKKWFVIIILAISQFVMILDSTVMNVSISNVAKDLGTTISGMQAAITFYALTMAAFMLTGGKLGDKWGRLTAFRIGSVVYGIGSLTTALSPSLGVLLFGWSFVEGLGAILVIPAIAALAAVNYKGKDRVIAFSILGAATGIAAAVGPLIGGLVTTYFSWRYVFAAETLVMLVVLFVANKIRDEKVPGKVSIDILSSVLSALGLSLLVFGVLQSKTWGWIHPLDPPVINGKVIAPFGISPVAYLILAGICVLWWFAIRQQKLESTGRNPLLKISLLSIPALRSGLSSLLSQYFTIAALFFVIPVYLQIILGYDALKTGIKLVPLSIGLVLFSALGSKLSTVRSAKNIGRWGQLFIAIGALFVLSSIDPELKSIFFAVGMFVVGAGFGLLASQLGNVNMSSVSKNDTSEVGGLQGTFQNLGSAFGTAIAGSVFILMLTSGFTSAIQNNTSLSTSTKNKITSTSQNGVQIVSKSEAEQLVIQNGGSQSTADTVANVYQNSQLEALRDSMFVVFAFSIMALFLSRNLPSKVK
ncbi:MAG TPA: MFS transporter [Candidatus Saccharimonadales bacterium]|nr:MFS transporter [Candidatus Saccharimonadales bacterium]